MLRNIKYSAHVNYAQFFMKLFFFSLNADCLTIEKSVEFSTFPNFHHSIVIWFEDCLIFDK